VSPVADSPSVTLSVSVHDSADKPISHDHSATPPQSIHDSLTIETAPMKISPVNKTSDNPSTTPPSIVLESPAAAVECLPSGSCDPKNMHSCNAYDIPATPPQSVHKNLQASPPQSEHTTPHLTSSRDQLHFNDPDIINTQLNYQISEVKKLLKEFP